MTPYFPKFGFEYLEQANEMLHMLILEAIILF